VAEEEDEVVEVVDEKGRLAFKGCRGRVLVALIVVAVLFLLLLGILFRGMMTKTTPPPRQRAAVEAPAYVSLSAPRPLDVGWGRIGYDLTRSHPGGSRDL
jgi:hypothetical protein